MPRFGAWVTGKTELPHSEVRKWEGCGAWGQGDFRYPVINNETHAACLSSKGIEQHSERLQQSPSARSGRATRCSRQVPCPRRPKSTLTRGTGSSASAARSPSCHSPEKTINKYAIPYASASHFPLQIRTTWWAEPGPRPPRSLAAGAGSSWRMWGHQLYPRPWKASHQGLTTSKPQDILAIISLLITKCSVNILLKGIRFFFFSRLPVPDQVSCGMCGQPCPRPDKGLKQGGENYITVWEIVPWEKKKKKNTHTRCLTLGNKTFPEKN